MGYLAILVATLLFSLNTVYIKYGYEFISPFLLMFIRFGIAFAIFLTLVVLGKIKLPQKKYFPGIFVAGFSSFLSFSFITYSLINAEASITQIIIATAPVFTLIAANIILKERATKLQLLGLLISLIGVLVLSSECLDYSKGGLIIDKSTLTGIIFALIAEVTGAIYRVSSRKISTHVTPEQITLSLMLVNLIGFGLLSLYYYIYKGAVLTFIPDIKALSALVYIAVGGSVLAYYFYQYSLKKNDAFFVSLSQYIQLPLSILFDFLILHELIGRHTVFSIVIILTGVVFASGAINTHCVGGKVLSKTAS